MMVGAAGIILCMVALGCGRIAFDPIGGGGDGSSDGATTALGGCWPKWMDRTARLGNLRQLTEVSTAFSEIDPFISRDGKTLYFARGATGSRDLYIATRPDTLSQFGADALSNDLSTAQDDAKITMTSSELVLVQSSARTGALGGFDLWQLSRATTADPWGGPTATLFAQINSTLNEYDPQLSEDGLTLYYTASLAPGQEIRVATRTSVTAAFDPATAVQGLGAFAVTADADISPDELMIFCIAAPDTATIGQLYYATRGAIGDPFQNPQLVPDVNSGIAIDGDPQLTADGCQFFFSSLRTGNRELYTATVQ